MRFFIPGAESLEQEARIYDSIKAFLGTELGAVFSDRQIRSLRWHHDGDQCDADVGEPTNTNGQVVIAILYEPLRDLYHVCTIDRGVARGGSILAGARSVIGVIDFDE